MNIEDTHSRSPWRTVLLVLVIAFADILLSIVAIGLGMEDGTVPAPETAGLEWARFALAPLLAPLGAVALIWRHRFPKSVAAAAVVLGAISFSGFAFFIALFLLAKRRLDWWVAGVIVLWVGSEALVGMEPLGWDVALTGVVILAAIAAWGAYRGQRARLRQNQIVSLKERADRVAAEHLAQVEGAQLAERHRIAREMHDTLAHRMSLVAVQAAALQVAAPDAETASSARLIRETAHAALGELRDVLGVLHEDGTTRTAEWTPVKNVETGRTDAGGQNRTAPSGIAQIPGLLAEWREAGVSVEYAPNPELAAVLPDTVSRAAFRVVQEGITNVARHAPETQAAVSLVLHREESENTELLISVSNGPGAQSEPALGAGLGLIGLAERIQLLGGSLDYGPTTSGFRLMARIPVQRQQIHHDDQEDAPA
ncbi:sensor histidine kinase [Arthrobacter sp. BF1]|uniref:sensor histidine kinase n=1 Tax=Arthrobacter sp. BF1 TaxID=2821145 RepID=UPI001C4E9D64|nr:histidine kinase [Arthrobacter sp. BF1]